MTQPVDAGLFELLDGYSREIHRCFVAEMFFNDARTEYILCFRPIAGSKDSPNLFACRYLNVEVARLETARLTKALPSSLTEELDRELRALTQAI
jgi:hypothetical protein